MFNPSEARPLEGLKVVDWTHVLSGPFAGYQLALLGAEVIRVESPGRDDIVRFTAADPELASMGLGETFIGQGSGKRSLALDVKQPAGKEAMRRLISSADVLLENYRPGKLAALGFDPHGLIEAHPALIVCSISGFGQDSNRRAYDHVVQASCGLMTANAAACGTPQRVGFPLVDYAVGQQAAMAVLAALYRRDGHEGHKKGARVRGEWLQVSMSNAALTLMAPAYIELLISGTGRARSSSTAFSGNPLSGTFEVEDGWIAIVCNAQAQSDGLLAALQESGADDTTLAGLQAAAAGGEVAVAQRLLGSVLRTGSSAVWEQRLSRKGVPAAAVRTPAQAASEAAAAWPSVVLPATPSKPPRKVQVPGVGFHSNLPVTDTLLQPPPLRGQDTRAVLMELGFTSEEVETLLKAGVATGPTAA